MKGVTSTTVGYQGGTAKNPTYGDVCSGRTGHTEVVEVKYDPNVVSFEQLLKLWLSLHEPTYDLRSYHGGQYRGVVFCTTRQQEETARNVLKREQSFYKKPIVSQVESAPAFWRAEDYHQQYYSKHKARTCSF